MHKNKFNLILKVISICINVSFVLSACAYSNNVNYEDKAEKKAENIVEYINNRDLKELANLFNEYSQESEDLERELKRFVNSIDGKIELYDFIYKGEKSSSIRDGKVTKQVVTSNLEKVETDQEKYYLIQFDECLIEENESLIGIECLSIRDENGKEIYTVRCE